VIVNCEDRGIRRARTAPARVPATGDRVVGTVWEIRIRLDSDVSRADTVRCSKGRGKLASRYSIGSQAQRIDDVRAKQIGVTDCERLSQALLRVRHGAADQKALVDVVRCGMFYPIQQIPAKYGMRRVQLIVDSSDRHTA